MGGIKQILPPRDQGDALRGIVHGDGQMIGNGDILPGEEDIAEQGGVHQLRACQSIFPRERTREEQGPPGMKAPRVGVPSGHAASTFPGTERPAGPGINRRSFPLWGGDGMGDFLARAKAGIKYP